MVAAVRDLDAEEDMAQARLVHNLHDNTWYIIDQNGRIISPVCDSLEQLRWALGQMCFAVNGEAIEVRV